MDRHIRTTTSSIFQAVPSPPENFSKYLELFRAAKEANWVAAARILEIDRDAATARIGYNNETILHIAAMARQGSTYLILSNLVTGYMTNLNLEDCKDDAGNTVLHLAALVGNTELADTLVSMNTKLLYTKNNHNRYPVHEAARGERRNTLVYLLSVSKDEDAPYVGDVGLELLTFTIDAEYFDIAVALVNEYPHLATVPPEKTKTILRVIVEKGSAAFRSACLLNFIETLMYYVHPLSTSQDVTPDVEEHIKAMRSAFGKLPLYGTIFKKVDHMKRNHKDALVLVECVLKQMERSKITKEQAFSLYHEAMMEASCRGIYEVIIMIMETFPMAVYCHDSIKNYTIFHEAIVNRCEDVYNLVYWMSASKHHLEELLMPDGNNVLHLCGKLAPLDKLNRISVPALVMQRELLWFEEVKQFVGAHIRRQRNNENKTPRQVFTEEHKELKASAEKWLKDTANSCIIAAALIATIVFTAAITVPGGNDADSGRPKWSKETAFIAFAVSDAISMFTSITCLAFSLSLLHSRYAEEDFLLDLPYKLAVAIQALLLSILFMMVAFCSALYLTFGQKKSWVIITLVFLAWMPTYALVGTIGPLFHEIYNTKYMGSKMIFGDLGTKFSLIDK